MKDIKIVIPSYKRPNNVQAVDNLPDTVKPYIIVRENERLAYEKNYGTRAYIRTIPDNVDGIGETRYLICKMFQGEKIFMVDDDIIFYKQFIKSAISRKTLKGYNVFRPYKRSINADELNEMFTLINTFFDAGYVFGYFSCRSARVGTANRWWKEDLLDYCNYFINLENLKAEDIGFNEPGFTKQLEDLHAILKMKTLGYTPLLSYHFLAYNNDPKGGGCSEVYNTNGNIEIRNKSYKKLCEMYPKYVNLKKSKYITDKKSGEKIFTPVFSLRLNKYRAGALAENLSNVLPEKIGMLTKDDFMTHEICDNNNVCSEYYPNWKEILKIN